MALQLTPLAVALQGIGFGTFLAAVQGLAVVEEPVPPTGPSAPPAQPFARHRRRGRRLPRAVAPSVAVTIEQDDEELALMLLGVL